MPLPLTLLLVGLLAMSIMMTVVWIVSLKMHNAGIVDVAWALGFSLAAGLYCVIGSATVLRQQLIAGMVIVWSLRLAWHLGLRFKRWFPHEDPRYADLRSKMGDDADRKMLIVFLWQGAVLTLMTASMAVGVADPRPSIGVFQYVAGVIWLIALCGESLADFQLSQFLQNPESRGRTCKVGLWNYSRHPNYFFEWLGCLSFFIYVIDSPFGLWTVISPVVLLHLLLNVTGVKPSEEHSMVSRSDYAEYMKTTSAFVPWFKRKAS